MNAWIDAGKAVMYVLLGGPASEGELWLGAALVVVTFAIFFGKLSVLLNYPLSALPLTVCVTALTVLVVVGLGAVAVRCLGSLDVVREHNLVVWLPFAALVVGTLLVVAPAMRIVNRSRYAPSVSGLVFSLLGVVIVVLVFNAISGAVHSGDKGFGKTRERTALMNEFLGN